MIQDLQISLKCKLTLVDLEGGQLVDTMSYSSLEILAKSYVGGTLPEGSATPPMETPAPAPECVYEEPLYQTRKLRKLINQFQVDKVRPKCVDILLQFSFSQYSKKKN